MAVSRIAKNLFIVTLFVVTTSGTAHAYLDPGTGSMMIQAVAGVILTATLTFKLWFGKLKEVFTKITKKKSE